MKPFKSIFIVLIIFSMTSGFAQNTKGKLLVGGSSSFDISSTLNKYKSDNGNGNDSKEFDFSFTPLIGFFVVNGLAIGLDAEISYETYKEEAEYASKYTDKYTTLVAGPFVRYYIGKGKIKPYVHLSAGGGQYKDVDDPEIGSSETNKYSIIAIKAGGGVGIFVNDHVSLDLGLQYFHWSSKDKENNDSNYKSLMGKFGFEAGIVVAL